MNRILKDNYKLAICLIVALATILRLVAINQSLWLDEATTAMVSKMPVSDIFTKFLPGDFHPPVYYLILKYWTDIFGYSEFSLRLPSIVFGISTVYVIYLIARELNWKLKNGNWKLPEVAAILLATSGLHIYYSQEARMYSLAAFFVSLTFLYFAKIIKKGRVGEWILFGLFLAASVATDYLPGLIIPLFWILGFLLKKDKDWWKKFVMSHIILVAFFLAWSPVFIRQITLGLGVEASSPGWWSVLGQTSLKNLALIPVKFILGRVDIQNNLLYGAVSGFLVLSYGWLIWLPGPLKPLKVVWLWFLFPVAASALVGTRVPVLSYFRLLFALPAFYLLLAAGISTLQKPKRLLALAFVLLVNLLSTTYYLQSPKFHREDWRSLTTVVEGQKTKNSNTVFVAESNMEAYLYYASDAKITGPKGVHGGYDQVWLMRYALEIFDPNDTTRAKVENLGYKKVDEYFFNGITVWKYVQDR
jgi:mannosyltransferase